MSHTLDLVDDEQAWRPLSREEFRHLQRDDRLPRHERAHRAGDGEQLGMLSTWRSGGARAVIRAAGGRLGDRRTATVIQPVLAPASLASGGPALWARGVKTS
jgi:hypothetical protein